MSDSVKRYLTPGCSAYAPHWQEISAMVRELVESGSHDVTVLISGHREQGRNWPAICGGVVREELKDLFTVYVGGAFNWILVGECRVSFRWDCPSSRQWLKDFHSESDLIEDTFEPDHSGAPLMHITFCDTNPLMCDAWRSQMVHFRSGSDIAVYGASILDLPTDAFVSPANSYGFMDGGIDEVYADAFPGLADAVRARVSQVGEIPVGTCELIRIPNDDRLLMVSPTMRVPMDVSLTVNAYLATRAALIRAKRARIDSIAFPGMCTGVGGMSHECSARQMLKATQTAMKPVDWVTAKRLHWSLINGNYCTDSDLLTF